MRWLLVLLVCAGLLGCGDKAAKEYSDELSNEIPKPREGSPDFQPFNRDPSKGGPGRPSGG